jgi:GDP-mannose 6-dehydrogenase
MLKLACDSWHALKVCFANEIGALCQSDDIDSQAVMAAFVKDKLLNISPAYLKPGFAFGGAGLSQSVAAVTEMADSHDLATPLLKTILASNNDAIDLARLAVVELRPESVGILGLAFKPGTFQFNSPARTLARRLRADGLRVLCFDADSPNRDEQSLTDVLECDVVVLASNGVNADVVRAMVGRDQTVVDLVGALDGHTGMMPRVVRVV